jgi:hypothetical protein
VITLLPPGRQLRRDHLVDLEQPTLPLALALAADDTTDAGDQDVAAPKTPV